MPHCWTAARTTATMRNCEPQGWPEERKWKTRSSLKNKTCPNPCKLRMVRFSHQDHAVTHIYCHALEHSVHWSVPASLKHSTSEPGRANPMLVGYGAKLKIMCKETLSIFGIDLPDVAFQLHQAPIICNGKVRNTRERMVNILPHPIDPEKGPIFDHSTSAMKNRLSKNTNWKVTDRSLVD